MSEFAVTFNSRHPKEPHPHFAGANRDGFLVIEARDEERARATAFAFLGPMWAKCIPLHEVLGSDRYPLGELGRIGLREPSGHLIDGFCPECGLRSLHVDPSGAMQCISPDCANPRAAAQILADTETEHIVEYFEQQLTVKHPLRERINDSILTCRILADLSGIAETTNAPADDGTYRVTALAAGGYEFEAVA